MENKDISIKREKKIKEISSIYDSSKIKDKGKLIDENLEKAAAFKIDEESKEVELLAIGIGEYADLIQQEAIKHNVPIYKDKDLTQELIKFDINTNLPPYMYDVIVQVINFVSKIEHKYAKYK
ncbi:MAG: EscU/YscU/HrcU family type III secretion system export apparatus switch protein [bacterium]|nr:EscU/YscU/HrcU family type III secretion system export apparatus switch protein [bacterium]